MSFSEFYINFVMSIAIDLANMFMFNCLGTGNQGYPRALSACEASLQALGRDYVDLYLIHWPGVRGQPRDDPSNVEARKGSWRALEELYRAGKCVQQSRPNSNCVWSLPCRKGQSYWCVQLHSEASSGASRVCHH